jgi:hypothetical protein
VHANQIALYLLAAIVAVGIAFLLWALLRLELEKNHRSGSVFEARRWHR